MNHPQVKNIPLVGLGMLRLTVGFSILVETGNKFIRGSLGIRII